MTCVVHDFPEKKFTLRMLLTNTRSDFARYGFFFFQTRLRSQNNPHHDELFATRVQIFVQLTSHSTGKRVKLDVYIDSHRRVK